MNPLIIVVIILFLSNKGTHGLTLPPYFDTFKMELLLDKLRVLTNSLEKINKVNQMNKDPEGKTLTVDRIHQSLDAIKDLLADHKAGQQLNTISTSLSGLKQLGDIENIISTIGPLLSLLSMGNDEEEDEEKEDL